MEADWEGRTTARFQTCHCWCHTCFSPSNEHGWLSRALAGWDNSMEIPYLHLHPTRESVVKGPKFEGVLYIQRMRNTLWWYGPSNHSLNFQTPLNLLFWIIWCYYCWIWSFYRIIADLNIIFCVCEQLSNFTSHFLLSRVTKEYYGWILLKTLGFPVSRLSLQLHRSSGIL